MVVVVLAAVVIGLSLLIRGNARRQANAVLSRRLPADLAARMGGEGPGIIYFYGAHCADCRQQSIIVEQLAREEGIALTRIDAAHETEMASALAVMTVPSTVIFDAARRVQAVNLGFRSRAALAAQLRGLAATG